MYYRDTRAFNGTVLPFSFQTEFPGLAVNFQITDGKIHDRFIVLDYEEPEEKMYLCGASAKDAGVNKTTIITELRTDGMIVGMHGVIDQLKQNPGLQLK